MNNIHHAIDINDNKLNQRFYKNFYKQFKEWTRIKKVYNNFEVNMAKTYILLLE